MTCDGAQITDAGCDTRDPRIICSHKIKPAALPVLTCSFASRQPADSLSFPCDEECFSEGRQHTEGLGWLGIEKGALSGSVLVTSQAGVSYKKTWMKAETAQWLTVSTALAKNLTSVPSTYVGWLAAAYNSSYRDPNTILWPLWAPYSCVQTHAHNKT